MLNKYNGIKKSLGLKTGAFFIVTWKPRPLVVPNIPAPGGNYGINGSDRKGQSIRRWLPLQNDIYYLSTIAELSGILKRYHLEEAVIASLG